MGTINTPYVREDVNTGDYGVIEEKGKSQLS